MSNIITNASGNPLISTANNIIVGHRGLEMSRGLISWQAARFEPVITDGTAQVQLADYSGKGNILTQATAENRALYRTNIKNGYPAFEFVSVDRYNWVNKGLLNNVTGASFTAVYKKNSGVSTQTLFNISVNASVSGRFSFLNNLATDLACQLGTRRLDADSANVIQVNQNSTNWFIVGGTLDYPSGKMRLYINGVLISAITINNIGETSSATNSLEATIGASMSTGANNFIGYLAEFRLHNVGLTQSEMNQDMYLLNEIYDVY